MLEKREVIASREHVENLNKELLHCEFDKGYIKYVCRFCVSYLMRKRVKMTKEYQSYGDDSYYYTIDTDNMDLVAKIFKENGYNVDLFETVWISKDKSEFNNLVEFKKEFNKLYREIKYNYIG